PGQWPRRAAAPARPPLRAVRLVEGQRRRARPGARGQAGLRPWRPDRLRVGARPHGVSHPPARRARGGRLPGVPMSAVSKKILIADDDASIRLVLSQAFTRLGYQVRATGNATTLLKWVSDGEGDLVVTDVVMPDENVFDVLPRIRKQRPKLPVIVMSAQNNLITAVNAAEVGAFEYVPKPFDLDDMTSAARRALSRQADAEASKAQARAVRDDRLPLIGRSGPMQEVYRTVARLVG